VRLSLYDVSKAFDCVDHTILLDKLAKFGFGSASLRLFESYLLDHSQCVEANGRLSSVLPQKQSVLQESVLVSLLFIIYINDFSEFENYYLFADDTTVMSSGATLSQLLFRSGEVQTKVESWFSNNKLVLNDIKTQELILSTSDNVSRVISSAS